MSEALSDLGRDLRLAIRTLLRQPGHAALSIIILALGMGAAIAMFSLMNVLVLRPLPYPDADRLVRVYRTSVNSQSWPHAPANFRDHRAQNTVFDGMAAFHGRTFTLAQPGQPAEDIPGMLVSADFLPILQARPQLGRLFLPEEDQYRRNQVVLISHELWQTRFGGDPQVVGRRLRIGGEAMLVVGVLRPDFAPPLLWGPVHLLQPFGFEPEALHTPNRRTNNYISVMARLKPGVSLAAAQQEMTAIAARLHETHGTDSGLRLVPLQQAAIDSSSKRAAGLALALAVFVLIIACINLAGVQLARLAGRGHEYALRAALGASRGRLIRLMLPESFLLALAGGLLGILLAVWFTDLVGSRMIVRGGVEGVAIPLDGRVLGFAWVLMVLTALAVGTVPAWLTSRAEVTESLKQAGRAITDRSLPRLRQGLVVTEMALALLMLATSGIFLRGLARFIDRDPGWQVDGLVSATLALPDARYPDEATMTAFLDRLERRLVSLPGVEKAALAWNLPLWNYGSNGNFVVEGAAPVPLGQAPLRTYEGVSPDLFATLGMKLLAGRGFTSADTASSAPVLVINQTFARRYFPGQSPLGKRIGGAARPGDDPDWRTIVGVVSDIGHPASINSSVTPYTGYSPLSQSPRSYITIILRTPLGSEMMAGPLRKAVAELDPEVPVYDVRTSREWIARTLANFSLVGWTLLAFAVLGLLLAALGVYGLFSGFVVQRTREIGVRMALGAHSGQVVRMILSSGLRLALLGALLGAVAALAVAPVATAAVAGLPGHDPATVAALAGLLVAVALFACWLPARRAASLPPQVALRQD